MLRAIMAFFRTGPDRPMMSEDPLRIRRMYEHMRWSVFLSVTLGYGFFYTVFFLPEINSADIIKPRGNIMRIVQLPFYFQGVIEIIKRLFIKSHPEILHTDIVQIYSYLLRSA